MILTTCHAGGSPSPVELDGLFHGATAMLVGGSPSLKTQDLRLLSERGVLSVAMNNAAIHFRPTMWVSSDDPRCFDPRIIADPGIMKFAPESLAGNEVSMPGKSLKYGALPNMWFYQTEERAHDPDWLRPSPRVPWMGSTLMHAIYILYSLGVRRIILVGSDFGAGPAGELYAHPSNVGNLEMKWNYDLYNAQADELRTSKTYFDSVGLSLMDASVHSRISHVYPHVSLQEALGVCQEEFPRYPADPKTLPHCSAFAPEDLKRRVAGLPAEEAPVAKTTSAPAAARQREIY